MPDEKRRFDAEALVTKLRESAAYKRALVLDSTKTEVDYQKAQSDWAAIYGEIFKWAAKEKTLSMLFFLDEQKQALGDDAYYAGIVKILLSGKDVK